VLKRFTIVLHCMPRTKRDSVLPPVRLRKAELERLKSQANHWDMTFSEYVRRSNCCTLESCVVLVHEAGAKSDGHPIPSSTRTTSRIAFLALNAASDARSAVAKKIPPHIAGTRLPDRANRSVDVLRDSLYRCTKTCPQVQLCSNRPLGMTLVTTQPRQRGRHEFSSCPRPR
jgi:hypothetical protein